MSERNRPRPVGHFVEYALISALFGLFRLLPLDAASWLGSFLARKIGPRLSQHRVAEKNLIRILPEKTAEERARILCGMWDNLGRVFAELPHLPHDRLIARLTPQGVEHVPENTTHAIFVSAHYGNWELSYALTKLRNLRPALVYRHLNNARLDKKLMRLRLSRAESAHAKGKSGASGLLRAIKDGQSPCMLIDQKFNGGIPIPFLGVDAMTAPAIAHFALRQKLDIYPARVMRTKGAHFIGQVYPKLEFTPTGNLEADTREILTKLNALIGEWVREYPEQWFWVHRRWPKETVTSFPESR